MARVLVNVMGDPNRAPVDVSELRKLGAEDRAITNSFLDWASVNREIKLSNEQMCSLTEWFKSVRY